ncbi:MAG: VWA domain-containing protein [Pyrinomonadaceae bacterium]
MKGSFLSLVLIALLASIGIAQSGRRVAAPAPTPKVETVDSYSETKPNPQRPPRVLPSMRSTNNDTTANKAEPQQTTGTVVENDETAIKVDTNLITIPVSVFDRNGLYIPNVQQNEFKIFEDGVEQEIAYFGTSDKPFSVILLLDVSYSTHYHIDEIRESAKAFVDQLKPQDRVMVIEFSESVRIRTPDFTSDRKEIFKAIDKADFGSGTSLYEAVDVSLRKQLSKVEGRKAVVLFTDGVDTTSRKATYDSTLEYAEESDALIFGIYYNTYSQNRGSNGPMWPSSNWPFPSISTTGRGNSASDYALGRKYVEDLSAYTGGRVFLPESTPGGLTRAFEGIAEELRRQYSIGYVPKDDGKPGQRKQIKVRVTRPNLLVRSRDSYIVGSGK